MIQLRLVKPSLLAPNVFSNFSPKPGTGFFLPPLIAKCKPKSQMSSYSTSSSSSSKLLFRQLFEKESSTYTYLLADISQPDRPALVSQFASFFFWVYGFMSNVDILGMFHVIEVLFLNAQIMWCLSYGIRLKQTK